MEFCLGKFQNSHFPLLTSHISWGHSSTGVTIKYIFLKKQGGVSPFLIRGAGF